MYRVGDWVSYPMHGAGVVEDIEERDVAGEIQSYYVLKFSVNGMIVKVPVDNIDEVGLRDVISREQCKEVISRLSQNEAEDTSSWNRRYRENLDKLRTGNIFDIADVVRSLTLRDRKKGLSTGEKKMLNNAKQILLSEISIVTTLDIDSVEKQIEESIAE